MNKVENAFFLAVKNALNGEYVSKEQDPCLNEDEWISLMRLSSEQEMLPFVFDAVCHCPSFLKISNESIRALRQKAVEIAACQAYRTNGFLTMIKHAQEQGLDPIVLKGITIRQLYPKPILRPSADEDLLVHPSQISEYHRFMTLEGATIDDKAADTENGMELSYHLKQSPTCIELHGSFLPIDSEAYGDCNKPLEGAEERCECIKIEDVSLRNLAPTDHLIFLFCHAFKHFLHGGVGIRQACDICVLARHYLNQIDFSRVRSVCDDLCISSFTGAILRIGRDYLGVDVLEAFADIDVDPEPLLSDMLSGGLYGVEDVNRAHSSTLTLEAVASHKKGRRRRGALHSIFLPGKALEGRYPYLKKHGWLLPVAWIERGLGYLKSRKEASVSPSETIRIGRERVELLRKYGIID